MQIFSDTELKTLSNSGLIAKIGKRIPSTRSKTGHISRKHVSNVLNGKVTTESDTNTEIIRLARQFIELQNQF